MGSFQFSAVPLYRILEKQNYLKNLTHLLQVLLFKDSREGRRGTGQIIQSPCAIYYYNISICCVIVPARLMRFPRVKADGQGFYHCVSRVVEGRFIFISSSTKFGYSSAEFA
jgi:hypothetical protein